MRNKNIPAIVVRCLIFAYEEQKGWVRLGGKNSADFSISNGTRQGSVLSPYIFSACYLDELIAKLRKLDIGCHIAGIWFGACAYADDICLLSNNRSTLQRMVKLCQDYGAEHNLTFSTDPDPKKSKTKCVLFSAKKVSSYPSAIVLDNKELPWVTQVEHLGHILMSNGSLEADAARARENLFFSSSSQRVKAIQLYCCDGYGSMLWNLRSEYSDSYFKAWNIQIRKAWRVSFKTHTYLVEDFFAKDDVCLRNQIYSRHLKFVRKLLDSPSTEIRFLSKIILNDNRSTLSKNVWFLSNLTNVNVLQTSASAVRKLFPRSTIPQSETWRLRLLSTFLQARFNRRYSDLNLTKKQNQDMLDSLCSS